MANNISLKPGTRYLLRDGAALFQNVFEARCIEVSASGAWAKLSIKCDDGTHYSEWHEVRQLQIVEELGRDG